VSTNLSHVYLAGKIDWKQQHDKDHEKHIHIPDLYVLWNQKSIWLADVAQRNPFLSKHFFWTDSGQFRDRTFLDKHFAFGEKWVKDIDFIPQCKVMFLSLNAYAPDELELDEKGRSRPFHSSRVTLGGGNFGGDSCAVRILKDLYVRKLFEYVANDLFAGKEQQIFPSVCVENKKLCFLIPASEVEDINDVWFALQPVLHGVIRPVPHYDPFV